MHISKIILNTLTTSDSIHTYHQKKKGWSESRQLIHFPPLPWSTLKRITEDLKSDMKQCGEENVEDEKTVPVKVVNSQEGTLSGKHRGIIAEK